MLLYDLHHQIEQFFFKKKNCDQSSTLICQRTRLETALPPWEQSPESAQVSTKSWHTIWCHTAYSSLVDCEVNTQLLEHDLGSSAICTVLGALVSFIVFSNAVALSCGNKLQQHFIDWHTVRHTLTFGHLRLGTEEQAVPQHCAHVWWTPWIWDGPQTGGAGLNFPLSGTVSNLNSFTLNGCARQLLTGGWHNNVVDPGDELLKVRIGRAGDMDWAEPCLLSMCGVFNATGCPLSFARGEHCRSGCGDTVKWPSLRAWCWADESLQLRIKNSRLAQQYQLYVAVAQRADAPAAQGRLFRNNGMFVSWCWHHARSRLWEAGAASWGGRGRVNGTKRGKDWDEPAITEPAAPEPVLDERKTNALHREQDHCSKPWFFHRRARGRTRRNDCMTQNSKKLRKLGLYTMNPSGTLSRKLKRWRRKRAVTMRAGSLATTVGWFFHTLLERETPRDVNELYARQCQIRAACSTQHYVLSFCRSDVRALRENVGVGWGRASWKHAERVLGCHLCSDSSRGGVLDRRRAGTSEVLPLHPGPPRLEHVLSLNRSSPFTRLVNHIPRYDPWHGSCWLGPLGFFPGKRRRPRGVPCPACARRACTRWRFKFAELAGTDFLWKCHDDHHHHLPVVTMEPRLHPLRIFSAPALVGRGCVSLQSRRASWAYLGFLRAVSKLLSFLKVCVLQQYFRFRTSATHQTARKGCRSRDMPSTSVTLRAATLQGWQDQCLQILMTFSSLDTSDIHTTSSGYKHDFCNIRRYEN